MPQVTIIVPIYNVEKYLSRCVKSILAQTLRDIEIILVDDGSPDSSGQIADEYASKYSHVEVIHKKNGGLSSARNMGMRMASGKYIGFVDSDDWIEPETFEQLLQTAEKYDTDVIMFDYTRKLPHSSQQHTASIDAGFYNRQKIIIDIFPNLVIGKKLEYGPVLSAWSCFYRLDFLQQNKIEFDEQIFFSEDSIFNSIVMEQVHAFYYLQKSFYNYYHNGNSISTTYKMEKWQNVKLLNDKIKKYFGSITYYDFQEQIQRHMVYFACNTLSQVCHSCLSTSEKRTEVKRILSDSKLSSALVDLTFPYTSWKFTIMIWLMRHEFSFLYSLLFCK